MVLQGLWSAVTVIIAQDEDKDAADPITFTHKCQIRCGMVDQMVNLFRTAVQKYFLRNVLA